MSQLPQSIVDRLRPWQIDPVLTLLPALKKHRAVVDLSDMGVGKTYVACAIAKLLQLPTLVICPKISCSMWHRVAEHFDDKLSVINYDKLRMGNSPYGSWARPAPATGIPSTLSCQCCQQIFSSSNLTFPACPYHPTGIHCFVTRKATWNYGRFRFAPQVAFTIFDEVHRCSARDSLNAEILIGAKADRKLILGLSATAACGPLQMRALGYALDLHTLTPAGGLGFYDWLHRHGCGKLPGVPGFRWTVGEARQSDIMRRLHEQIIPARGVRVRTDSIPNFPTRTIIAEEYDIENPNQIDALYEAMRAPLERLESRAATDIAPDSPLTKLLRAQQRLEILKVPLAVELCEDDIAKGCSVIIFCNFTDTIDSLAERLKTDCIIDGRRQHLPHRQDRLDAFQANHQKVILVNNKAGNASIGFQDLHGGHPRSALVFPCDDAVIMRQIFGRLPRDGGLSHSVYRVLFAAGTVEGGMARRLRAKSNNLDSLNDADFRPDNFTLTRHYT